MSPTASISPAPLTALEADAQRRLDFAAFAQQCFRELNPLVPLAMNWHVEIMTAKLAGVYRGEFRRVIINVPPRYLKSLLGSVAFPAWCLGRRPGMQIVCASYAQDLADKLGRDCRRIVTSDWFERAFPTRLSAQRQAANDWFDHTLLQPAQRQEKRRHRRDHASAPREPALGLDPRDDLVGHVLAQEDWEIVRFPAIAEEDETWEAETYWGPRHFTRPRGEALHPDRETAEMLEQIRRTIGEYDFAGQYQQAPAPQGGGMVKAAWFCSYAPNERPDKFDRVAQSWDTANKASELSPHPNPPPLAGEGREGGTTWGIRGKDLYLLHVLRKRREYPELTQAVPSLRGEHRA